MSEPTTCPERISNGMWSGYRTCGRPVKMNGLCGLHASARERAKKKSNEREQRVAEGVEVADALGERTGLPFHYDDFKRAVYCSLSPEKAAELVATLPPSGSAPGVVR